MSRKLGEIKDAETGKVMVEMIAPANAQSNGDLLSRGLYALSELVIRGLNQRNGSGVWVESSGMLVNSRMMYSSCILITSIAIVLKMRTGGIRITLLTVLSRRTYLISITKKAGLKCVGISGLGATWRLAIRI